MPYADEKKKAEYDSSFRKNTYFSPIQIKIRRTDESFYAALQAASEAQSITPAEYMRRAARESLKCDGYLTENKDAE